jgi:hypothetical protein
MPVNAALFLFIAASVISVFAFLSIVVWVSTPAQERQARDRIALLRSAAESQGENAARVIEMLREEDRLREERRLRDERKGYLMGGMIVTVVGIGLSVMLWILGNPKLSSVGLIPFLVGCVLLGFGVFSNKGKAV